MPVDEGIRKAVERKLKDLLKKGAKPEKEELQTLNIAVKYLSVAAKMDGSEYGTELAMLNNLDDDGDDSDLRELEPNAES
jgi:hypothetical protein